MSDNGGKWQLAFWIMGIICTLWLMGLTNGVVANEKTGRDRDDVILKQVNIQYIDVVQRLARIEIKIDGK